MSFETAIFVTTFALLGASLLLSGTRELHGPPFPERGRDAELDARLRTVLLFTTKVPVAHC